MFAVDSYGKLYGLSPDGKSVFEYEDKPMTWKKIGNDAGQIYAGGERLFATNPTKGDIYEYNGKAFDWIKIGGPGKMFAVADNGNLYKISTDGQSVWQYENKSLQWKKIGGAATKIAAGKTLYITKPPSNDVYQYDATLASWTKIGHPAKEIYARSVDLFAASPKNGDIFRYNHTPLSWTKIGGPGKMFAAGYLSTPYYLKFGEKTVLGNGTASLILEVEPGHPDHVYMGFKHFANGPRYFAEKPKPIRVKETDGYQCNTYAPLSASNQKRLGTETLFMGAGEGSVWLGNFSGFKTGSPASQRADWTQLPGPPVYFGVSTPSGRVYASVHPTSSGHLVFFADRSHLHMTTGRPTVNGWHRLDGYDISACWKDNNLNNRMLMHVDPHALVVSPDFNVSLKAPTGVAFMYAKNKVLDRYYNGRIWVANDGGIYSSSDGGKTWHLAYYGPNTLLIVNLAGVVVKGKAPAFYMGMGDNDDYFTMDGGKTWVSQFGGCGDCGHWFADPAHPSRVVELGAAGRRGPYIFSYTNGSGGYPDLSDPKKIQIRMIPHPKDALYNANNGSRVLVCTTVGESSSSPDDYVVIQKKGGSKRILLRAKNLQSHSDMSGWKYSQVDAYWQKNSIWKQVGKKELPANCNLVQASGGHSNTVFFVGDGNKLYRSHRDNKGEVDSWDTIVPGKGASVARRFFVNPYDSKNIYIVDANGVKCWDDKKQTWGIDKSLEKLASENGEYHYNASSSNCILTDMFFYRNDSEQRFAAGTAGVFYTLDGTTWHRVLDTNALPCRPRSVFFDPYERSLYLATEGRGVLKIYPIPKPGS